MEWIYGIATVAGMFALRVVVPILGIAVIGYVVRRLNGGEVARV